MSESGKTVYRPPQLSKGPLVAFLGAVILASFIFLALPLTQLLSGLTRPETREIANSPVFLPPPAPPLEPPPSEEQEVEEAKPELEHEPQSLNLSQLDVVLNPGVGDALSLGSAIIGFGVTPDTIAQMEIFELKDLDRTPRRLFAVGPVYPFQLRREGIEGRVRLIVIIDQRGRVIEATAQNSMHRREFEQSAIDAVLKWKFEPPLKNGNPVKARYYQAIDFSLRK